jgi:steroid delta-isomerase-like uncharacterized protein
VDITQLVEWEDRLWQTGKWDDAAAVYADEVVFINAGGDMMRGRDAVVEYFRREQEALPSTTQQETVAVDGSVAVVAWTMTGQHTKDLLLPSGTTIPATGRSFSVDGLTVIEVADDRIVSMRRYHDRLGVLTQLGLMPSL